MAGDQARHLLSKLLSGQFPELPPLAAEPIDVVDTALDPNQREAVAKAVQTPDICLIQGLPGTGKSRVIAEIVTQAALQGKRVLLLAPTGAAIDRILELTAGRDVLCPVRCLGRDEHFDVLTAVGRSFTYEERVHHLKESWLARAREHAQAAGERHDHCTQASAVWPEFEELAERQARLEAQAHGLQCQRSRTAQEVEDEAAIAESGGEELGGGFAAVIQRCLCTRDNGLKRTEIEIKTLHTDVDDGERQKQTIAALLDELLPLARARQDAALVDERLVARVVWRRLARQGCAIGIQPC